LSGFWKITAPPTFMRFSLGFAPRASQAAARQHPPGPDPSYNELEVFNSERIVDNGSQEPFDFLMGHVGYLHLRKHVPGGCDHARVVLGFLDAAAARFKAPSPYGLCDYPDNLLLELQVHRPYFGPNRRAPFEHDAGIVGMSDDGVTEGARSGQHHFRGRPV